MRSSRPMRHVPALALLTLAAALAGCGPSNGSPPAAFVVRPDISDSLCNGGRGIRLSIPSWREKGGETGTAHTSSGSIAGGSTVIAFSGWKRYPVLHLVTPRCELDRQFGIDGTAMITIPSSLRSPHSSEPGAEELSISAVAARNGGGAILAGNYAGEPVVAEITEHGTLDTSFGDDGWALLPFRAGARAILQEPSGRIIVGGEEPRVGRPESNWAAALSAHGQFDPTFGGHGRVELPTGGDSGIDRLELEPDGDILVKVSGGKMGCFYTKLAMMTPSGQPVPKFATRLDRFWRATGFHAFVGDVYIDGDGFTLVGTGQGPCFDSPTSPSSLTGVIARFLSDGRAAAPTIRFPSRISARAWDGQAWAFPESGDIFFVTEPYFHAEPLEPVALTALRPNGSADPQFAIHGRAQILAGGREGSGERLSGVIRIINAGPGEITLLAEVEHDLITTKPSELAELQLIRLRL